MKRTIIIALSVVALVFGVISYATAEVKSTDVIANVPGVLSLTVDDTLLLGNVSPEQADPTTGTLDVTYKTNRTAELSSNAVSEAQATVTSSLTTENVRGHKTVTDTIGAKVTYLFDPANNVKLGDVTYTLVQIP